MLKFAAILVLVCIVWRWALGQWPWHSLRLPPTRQQEIAKARKLLGLEEIASREQVLAAHRQVIASVHPDRGGSSAAVHEANEARDVLLATLPAKSDRRPPDADQ
jgi:hypothetical protein